MISSRPQIQLAMDRFAPALKIGAPALVAGTALAQTAAETLRAASLVAPTSQDLAPLAFGKTLEFEQEGGERWITATDKFDKGVTEEVMTRLASLRGPDPIGLVMERRQAHYGLKTGFYMGGVDAPMRPYLLNLTIKDTQMASGALAALGAQGNAFDAVEALLKMLAAHAPLQVGGKIFVCIGGSVGREEFENHRATLEAAAGPLRGALNLIYQEPDALFKQRGDRFQIEYLTRDPMSPEFVAKSGGPDLWANPFRLDVNASRSGAAWLTGFLNDSRLESLWNNLNPINPG